MAQPNVVFVLLIAVVMVVFVAGIIGVAWLFAKVSSAMLKGGGPTTQPMQYPTLRPALVQLGQKYGGKLLPGSAYEFPRLTFLHQGAAVLVDAWPIGPPQSAQSNMQASVRFHWPDGAFRLEVYPEGLMAQFRKLIGMRDIEVGEPAFDRKYMITSNDAAKVRGFLTPEVRQLIALIRGPRYGDDVYVHVVGGKLLIKKRNLQIDDGQIPRLVELSLALYDAALREPLAGIEFVEELVIDPDSPICQVCGEEIAGPEVMCAGCQTPHHRDCWHYYGGCSVYGCRGKEHAPYGTVIARRLP